MTPRKITRAEVGRLEHPERSLPQCQMINIYGEQCRNSARTRVIRLDKSTYDVCTRHYTRLSQMWQAHPHLFNPVETQQLPINTGETPELHSAVTQKGNTHAKE